MDQIKFNSFADDIFRLKDQIKDINGDIKEAIENFAEENGMTVKGTKKALKEIEEYRKNRDEFITSDQESSSIVNMIVYPEV